MSNFNEIDECIDLYGSTQIKFYLTALCFKLSMFTKFIKFA